MAHTIVKDGSISFEITPSALDVPSSEEHVRELLLHLKAFHETAGVTAFLVRLTTTPRLYTYEFEGAGKTWKQWMQFAEDYNQNFTFTQHDISPGWTFNDSNSHRDIRAHILELIRLFQFDRLEAKW